jgi:predicted O-methyltransferase YrrM
MAGQQDIYPRSSESQDWERSEKYHNSFLIPKDDILDAVVRNNEEQGLRNIAVPTAQGKLLHLLAKSIGAKKILEVGTLGG